MHDLPLPMSALQDLVRPLAASSRPTASRPARAFRQAGLQVAWAKDEEDVRDAQRLRFDVFVREMGARIEPPRGTPHGIDADAWDPFCEHLLVRLADTDNERGEVVGTYRVLTPASARRAGGLYTETEFDLSPLRPLRSRMVELGRSCVHRDHRSGGVILQLWGALAAFMVSNGLQTMVGCASIAMVDGGRHAAGLWRQLARDHLAAPQWRVLPKLPLPVNELDCPDRVEAPALIKDYLRCGSTVLGPPAWDPQFNTADLPMLMNVDDLPARYQRHFLGAV